jgi:hypothetical protein
MVLQRDPPAGKLSVLRAVDGLLPVQRHGEGRALGGDLIDVLFAGDFRHRRYLGDVDDRAGAIGGVGPPVPDVHFVGGLAGHFGGIGAANEDAAVGVVIDPELGAKLEIRIGVLRNQEPVALVGNGDTVRDFPVRVADLIPVVEVLAVEQRDPACALGGRVMRDRESNEPNQKQRDGGS